MSLIKQAHQKLHSKEELYLLEYFLIERWWASKFNPNHSLGGLDGWYDPNHWSNGMKGHKEKWIATNA